MKNKKHSNERGFSNFGFSSILLAFVMLCIITFAALALVTANSDYRLSKKVADKNTAYYKAESAAFARLQSVDQLLADAYVAAASLEEYYTSATAALENLPDGELSREDGFDYYTFEEIISDTQALHVTVLLNYPQQPKEGFYSITTWQTVLTQSFDTDSPLNLFGS